MYKRQKYDISPDIVTYAKSFGGGKSSIAGFTARDNIFKNSYGNLNDATLHSTTYNGFGEETITAIESINIIIEDDYVEKSKKIHRKINSELKILQRKFPKIIKDVRGAGSLNGIIIRAESSLIRKITKLLPSSFFKDERFLPKLATASVISELYDEHNILTFYGSNTDIPLIISPPLIVKEKEIDYFISSLDQVLQKGLLRLIAKFAKNKFLKK